VTIVGLSKDDSNPEDPFVQLVFDSSRYGNNTFAIEFGRANTAFTIQVTTIQIPEITSGQDFYSASRQYYISRTASSINISVGDANKTVVFNSITYLTQNMDSNINGIISQLSQTLNLRFSNWMDTNSLGYLSAS
jgi:hypothetical protein